MTRGRAKSFAQALLKEQPHRPPPGQASAAVMALAVARQIGLSGLITSKWWPGSSRYVTSSPAALAATA